MAGPTTTRWRWLRSAVLAVLAAQIAVVGHLLGGGMMPDPGVVLTVAAIQCAALTGLAGKPHGFLRILGVMVGAQLVFHLMFMLSAHHDMPLNLRSMVLFHLLAALISAWLLADGDRLLFELFAGLCRILPRRWPPRPAVDSPLCWTASIGAGDLGRRVAELSTPRPRRGPPLTT